MAERQAGVTALITAYARAYHATHDHPKIFNDFLADQLFTAEEHVLFDRHLAGLLSVIDPELVASNPSPAQALALVMQLHNAPITLCRSRFVEDQLDAAIAEGAPQYVILGAGFDTFAFRRTDLMGRLKVLEVDHPVTQALKKQRVAAAGWLLPDSLTFIPIDFARDNLMEVIKESSFSPHQKSFFSWLGVTFYLTQEVVMDTLKTVAELAVTGSTITFDYLDNAAFDPKTVDRRVKLMMSIAGQAGEPMKSGFDPSSLQAILKEAGFLLVEDLGPGEIQNRYFNGRHDLYRAFEQLHLARAVKE